MVLPDSRSFQEVTKPEVREAIKNTWVAAHRYRKICKAFMKFSPVMVQVERRSRSTAQDKNRL